MCSVHICIFCLCIQANKDTIAYPKEVHSKIMQRRISKDMGDGKSPKIFNSPYKDMVCVHVWVTIRACTVSVCYTVCVVCHVCIYLCICPFLHVMIATYVLIFIHRRILE